MDTPGDLIRACEMAFQRAGTDSAPLTAQAEALLAVPEPEFEQALDAFNTAANNPAYYAPAADCDFGSLLLEAVADRCSNQHLRQQLYQEALGRAALFASYATSGGEGLARSMEIERIARKLEQFGGQQER